MDSLRGYKMTTIMPKGQKLRQAVIWISENLKNDTNIKITKLIQEAAIQFNLSPINEDYLRSLYKEKSDK